MKPIPNSLNTFQIKRKPEFTTQVKWIKRLRARVQGLSPPRSHISTSNYPSPLMTGGVTVKAPNYPRITPTITNFKITDQMFPKHESAN